MGRQVKIRISKEAFVIYSLELEMEGYSISCVELSNCGNVIDVEKVKGIDFDYGRISDIFDLLIKNKVCPCALYDVICDLIC